jgi:hypothetical protein
MQDNTLDNLIYSFKNKLNLTLTTNDENFLLNLVDASSSIQSILKCLGKQIKISLVQIHNIQSLVQILYSLFTNIISSPRFLYILNTNNNSIITRSSLLQSSISFWTKSLELLTLVANSDQKLFLAHWPLFLNDSLLIETNFRTVVDKLVSKLCALPDHQSQHESTVIVSNIVNIANILCDINISSSVFHAALYFQDSSVQVSALQCIRAMLTDLPLEKWFQSSSKSSLSTTLSSASSSAVVSRTNASSSPSSLTRAINTNGTVSMAVSVSVTGGDASGSMRTASKPLVSKKLVMNSTTLLGNKVWCTKYYVIALLLT